MIWARQHHHRILEQIVRMESSESIAECVQSEAFRKYTIGDGESRGRVAAMVRSARFAVRQEGAGRAAHRRLPAGNQLAALKTEGAVRPAPSTLERAGTAAIAGFHQHSPGCSKNQRGSAGRAITSSIPTAPVTFLLPDPSTLDLT